MEAAKTALLQNIQDPRGVTMFSKSYCPYCQQAQRRIDKFLGEYKHPKDARYKDQDIKDEEQPYKVLELDLADDQVTQTILNDENVLKSALEGSGAEYVKIQSSVPNIWIGGKQIGGCDDLMKVSDKDLKAKLEAAGAKLL